jgi:hypothetical protein
MTDLNIPQGTFQADFQSDSQRVSVVKTLIRKIGEELILEHAEEIKDMYENPDIYYRNRDIAKEVIPNEFKKNEGIAEKAVGYAIKRVVREDVRRGIERWRKAKLLEERSGAPDSPEFRDFCSNASARRHELHGVDHKAMTRGRGFVPWETNEKAYVLILKERGYGNGEGSPLG